MTLTVYEDLETDNTCSIEGCENPKKARSWCSMHYQRWSKHGDPLMDRKKIATERLSHRFWSKVKKGKGCWEWTGVVNDAGYGIFHYEKKGFRAHRWSWQIAKGEIPNGMQIDHICRNRLCINPDHLRLATNKQNAENTVARKALSGYRGVSFNKNRKKWIVQVGHNGKNCYGGYFSNPKEAAVAAKKLRNELFTHNTTDRAAR